MYKIAGLNISISGGGAMLAGRAEAYRTMSAGVADLSVELTQDYLQKMHLNHPHLTEDECAYIYTGEDFWFKMFDHGCFKIHASAVVLDNQAYLFSAPSGTGKSTHTSLWCDYFGPSRAYILNDDAPIIKRVGDEFIAWGSPWSGASPLNRNAGVPLKAIAFLERSQSDWISPMASSESIVHLMEHTCVTHNPERMKKLMSMLDGLLYAVPIYRLGCTVSRSAVEIAYDGMSK